MRKLPPIAYIAIAFIAAFLVKISIPQPSTLAICDAAEKIDRVSISCGSRILLTPPAGMPHKNKQAGFAAMKAKDYTKAIDLLQKDFNLFHDPETLIARNNAEIDRSPPTKVKTVAVVVPASDTPIFVSTNILKGVAEAQRKWNQADADEHNWKLKIVLADDKNSKAEGVNVANELIQYPDLLAVMGNYSSTVTAETKDIYQQHKTVLLSATATADELSNMNRDTFFFRVVPKNSINTQGMVAWGKKFTKIALFYTPNGKFSESIRHNFLAQVGANRIVKEFDLTRISIATQEIATAKAMGAQAIAVFADSYTDDIERDRTLAVIKANQGELPVLGSSVVEDTYLFQLTQKTAQNLTVSVPVHSTDRRWIDTEKLAQTPNWWGSKTQIHERIILANDAMTVLIAALDKADDRAGVQQVLSNPNFQVQGITGKISFKGSDRAEPMHSLIAPSCAFDKCEGFHLIQ
jgi:ABC-type branched-subunit amino acid transport system substrate-binding protein